MSSKRIVAHESTGIRRIVGTTDQLDLSNGLPTEIQLEDGRIFSLTESRDRYIRYTEKVG